MKIYKFSDKNAKNFKSARTEKVANLIKEAVSSFFIKQQIIDKDKEVISVIVTKIDLSSDLRNAKIYVRWFNKSEFDEREFLGYLEQHSYYLTRDVLANLHLKYIPKFKFYYDESFDSYNAVMNLLKDQKLEENVDEFLDSDR